MSTKVQFKIGLIIEIDHVIYVKSKKVTKRLNFLKGRPISPLAQPKPTQVKCRPE